MTFSDISNSVKKIFKSFFPSFNAREMLKSEDILEEKWNKLLFSPTVLNKLGFPLNINDGSIESSSLSLRNYIINHKPIEITLNDVSISCYPSKSLAKDKSLNLMQYKSSISINNFRLTIILSEKTTDYILITAKKIVITVSPGSTHIANAIGLNIFYLYSSVLSDLNIDFTITKDDHQTRICSTIDTISTNISSKQFVVLKNLFSSLLSSIESNIFDFKINKFEGHVSDGTFAIFSNLRYVSGLNHFLYIEKSQISIEKINFVINNLRHSNNDIEIQSIDKIDVPGLKFMTLSNPFISTTSNIITISNILIESKFEKFIYLVNILKSNVFVQFLKNCWKGEPPPKVMLNSIKFIFGDFELNMSISITSSIKISQVNYTQIALAYKGSNFIFKDIIIQNVQMMKNERYYLSIFMGLVPIRISFEELLKIIPLLKLLYKSYQKDKHTLPPIYDINIPQIEVSIGERLSNKFNPIISIDISSAIIKGKPINDETKYKTSVNISLKYFHDNSGISVSIINKMLINLEITDSIKSALFLIDFIEPSKLIITKRLIELIKNYSQIKDKDTFDDIEFINNTNTPFLFHTESSEHLLKPLESHSIKDYLIKLTESAPFVRIRSLFNGMKANGRILDFKGKRISIEYQQAIKNSLSQSITVFKFTTSKPFKIATIDPQEIAEFREDCCEPYLIACNEQCAMASSPTSFSSTSSIQVILDGIQKACVVSKVGRVVHIRPYIRLKNEIQFKLVAKLSLVDIIETVSLNAFGEVEIAMPFYPSIQTNLQLSYDGKLFSMPIGLTRAGTSAIELSDESTLPFQTSISNNEYGQLVLTIKSLAAIINQSTADLTLYTREGENDLNAELDEEPSAPFFVLNNKNGITVSPDFEISVGSTTTREKVQKNGLLKLQLKTNSSLYYPLSVIQNDNMLFVKDGIWFENRLDMKVTVVINSVIFLAFDPGEAGAISVTSADGSAALSMENYSNVAFPMTSYASSAVEFESDELGPFIASLTIDKGDRAQFEITLSKADLRKPQFAIINDFNDQISFRQHGASKAINVEPHSMRPFGLTSLIEIPVFDIEYKQAKAVIDITQTGVFDACVFKYKMGVLENGTHVLHINPPDDNKKFVNANISFNNLIVTYCDDVKESLELNIENLKIAIGTKEFYRLLQISADSFKLADISEKQRYLLKSSRIEGFQSILIKAAFNDRLQIGALSHLSVSIQELVALKEFDFSTLSEMKSFIKQIPIIADEITINPIVINIFNAGFRFIFPAISTHNICWSIGGISNYLHQFYSEKWRFYTIDRTLIPSISSPISYIRTVLPGFYAPGAHTGRLSLSLGERPHPQPVIVQGSEFSLRIAEGRGERTPIQKRVSPPPRAGSKLYFGAPLPAANNGDLTYICSFEAGKRYIISFGEKFLAIAAGRSVHCIPYGDVTVKSINGSTLELMIEDDVFSYQMKNDEIAEFVVNLIQTMRDF